MVMVFYVDLLRDPGLYNKLFKKIPVNLVWVLFCADNHLQVGEEAWEVPKTSIYLTYKLKGVEKAMLKPYIQLFSWFTINL